MVFGSTNPDGGGNVLQELPRKLEGLDPKLKDAEIARLGIIAELDAINLYEQMANLASDPGLKKVLEDIANEEKTHVGEFLEMLKKLDPRQIEELGKGKKEVEELTE